MIYHVVAVSQNGVIGKDGKLPWHFPADLKFFKNLTTGHTVIMGRKTFDSIGKALPNRENFVLSKKGSGNPLLSGQSPTIRYFGSIETALQNVKTEQVFIIGGVSVYQETLHLIDGIYLTHISQSFEGDAFYPGIPAGFKEVSRQTLQEEPLMEAVLYQRE